MMLRRQVLKAGTVLIALPAQAAAALNVKDFKASGLTTEFQAQLQAGSTVVPLSKHDFAVGQGVKVFGAGAVPTLAPPSLPNLRLTGAGGSTSYRYALAYFDLQGAATVASPIASINGPSTLTAQNGIQLTYAIPQGVFAVAIYRSVGSAPLKLFYVTGNYQNIIDTGVVKGAITVKGVPSSPPTTPQPGYLLTKVVATTPRSITLREGSQATQRALLVHDDTEALQAALNTLQAKGGGTLYFPKGTYLVKRLDCGSKIRLYSDNKSATLKRQHWIMDGDHWHGNGILANRLEVRYDNAGNRTGTSKDITLENLVFDGNREQNRTYGDWASAALVSLKGCTNLKVTGNEFRHGIDAGCNLAEGSKIQFVNNFSGNHGKPYEHPVEPIILQRAKDLTVLRNTFINCSDGINLIAVEQAVVSNNTMRSCGIGFDIWGAKNTKVTSNTIIGNPVNAISVLLENNGKDYIPSYNVEVSNNIIDGTQPGGGYTNTAILAIDATDWIIKNNKIKNCTHGIHLKQSQAAGAKSGDITVENNTIDNMEASGIIVVEQTVGKVVLKGNTATKIATRYPEWGGITLANGNKAEIELINNRVERILTNPEAWQEPRRISGSGNTGRLEGAGLTSRGRDALNSLFRKP